MLYKPFGAWSPIQSIGMQMEEPMVSVPGLLVQKNRNSIASVNPAILVSAAFRVASLFTMDLLDPLTPQASQC